MLLLVIFIKCTSNVTKENVLPLPSKPLHLVGRENDTQIAKQILLNDSYNMLSIVGPPGVGKSAFAIAVGHECSSHMEVMYVDMQELEETEEFGQFISDKMKSETWMNKISILTLLIVDNCDKHTLSGPKLKILQKHITMWTNKAKNLKLVMTNQAEVPWSTNKLYTFSLKYLSLSKTVILFKDRLQKPELNEEDFTILKEVVNGMPLAIENIATFVDKFANKSKGFNDLKPNVKSAQKALKFFNSNHFLYTSHTVPKSIAMAYDNIQENDKQCKVKLVDYFGLSFFNEAEATTVISDQNDYENCINNLLQAQLLITKFDVIQDVEEPGCMINNTEFIIFCKNYQKFRPNYRFHPLVASYMHPHKTKKHSKRDIQVLMNKPKQGQYEHFVTNALKRFYCPHQYVLLNCSSSWNEATKGMFESMKAKHSVSVNERIQIGVRAVYWSRAILKDIDKELKHVSEFINSSLTQIQLEEDYKNKPDQLAAYIFYNHKSLRIKWESKIGQSQCFCPNAKDSVPRMKSREIYINKLYSQISNDHLAWSASRSFYLDLECCCRVFEGCEHRWKYWIKGIVSQVATTQMYFQQNIKNRCDNNVKHLPPKAPTIIEGLWHYSFTKQRDNAITLLKKYLKEKTNFHCPLLKIAAVMVLHEFYHDTEEEYLDSSLGEYINNNMELIDTNIENYKTFYHDIIIPFLYEIGQSKVAQKLYEQLNLPFNETNQHTQESFECTLLHQHHRKNFREFFCLTL